MSLADVPPPSPAIYPAKPAEDLSVSDNTKLDLVVVLAVSKMDWHLAVKWLQLGYGKLGTGRRCTNDQGVPCHTAQLIVWMSPALPEAAVKLLKQAVGINKPADEDDELWVTFAQCAGLNEVGYFGSPNQMFRGALDFCETNFPGWAMLWCESDTVPMQDRWVEKIQEEYRACGKPFMGDVHLCEINHMTGNGVYHPEWRKYAPSLALLPGPDPQWGWDSQCAHETFARCHVAKTIQQIWRPEKIDAAFLAEKIRPECALFHQDKAGHLIDLVCDREGILRFGNYEQLEKSTYGEPQHLRACPEWPSTNPRVEIFIVTFWRDIEYLRYLLRSIEKFARGFAGVTLLVPDTEDDGRYKFVPKGVRVAFFKEIPGKGMLGQLEQKCLADLHCPGADFILHLDADSMFLTDTTPADFIKDGKVVLVREKYEICGKKNPARLFWQQAAQRALGFLPEYETMVRHPNVYHAGLYQKTRQLIELNTGVPFSQYVLSQQEKFPQGFAEFPTLGAVAIRDFAPLYSFVDYNRTADAVECGEPVEGPWQYLYRPGRDHVVEFYSRHPVQRYWPAMDAILKRQLQKHYVK